MVQLAFDPQQLSRERAQRRAPLVRRGARVCRHAVGRDRDPAAGLARRHDRPRLPPALQAEGGVGAVHRLSVNGATLGPPRRARECSSTARSPSTRRSSAARPTSTPPFMSATPGPSARSPSVRTGRRRRYHGKDRVVMAEQQDPARAPAVRPRNQVQADRGRRQVDRAARLGGPLGDQRCAGIEALEVARRRVDRAQPAQALEHLSPPGSTRAGAGSTLSDAAVSRTIRSSRCAQERQVAAARHL